MQRSNDQQVEEEECSICLDDLRMYGSSKFSRATCCGKGMHNKCRDSSVLVLKSRLSEKQKNQCVMCRAEYPESQKEAVEQLCPWVEKGKAWAQIILGSRYRDGDGVEQSYQQAKELFELAASQGNASAQYNLGIMYQEGQGVDQSYERAAEFYEAAARQGLAEAQYTLGNRYYKGKGVEQSIETAREWWMKSAKQGQEIAIGALQQLDEEEGRTTPSFTPPKRCSLCDTPETPTHKLNDCPCYGAQYCNAECQTSQWKMHKKEHRRLCKEMNLKNTEGEMKDEVVEEVEEVEEGETKETVTAPMQQQEGGNDVCPVCIEPLQKSTKKFNRYTCCVVVDEEEEEEEEEEEDVCPVCIESLQKDSNKFIRYTCCGKGIHKWCDKGIDASSLSDEQKNCCPLCRAKYPMTGSKEEIEQIHRWVEKGKAWAQSMLGDKYRHGRGVGQSYQQARELFEFSASQGDASAQMKLGFMYDHGQGVDQSYERAREYYEAAAKQGDADAQYNLGALYANGEGVEQSNETAREWWMKAAEQGEESAIKGLQQLDEFEGRTTPSFVPKPFECASCYRPHDPPEHKLNACNRCHQVYYCGRECQVKHWKKKMNGHKKKCNKKTK